MKKKNGAARFLGITPYLLYDDAPRIADWLTRHLGFEEISRYYSDDGAVTNIERRVGENEIWLDNYSGYWAKSGRDPDQWIGIWVADVSKYREILTNLGVEAGELRDRDHGVREFSVKDPQGYTWGFLQRP